MQEAGVDEPDIAKTDGERVVLMDGADLVVVDVTGPRPEEVGRLQLDRGRRPDELLLVGDRVLLLGGKAPRGLVDGLRLADPALLPGPSRGTATITTVDITDPTTPTVVADEDVDGSVVSAREAGGIVRIVISSRPRLDFVHPGRGTTANQARRANRQVIRTATAADWLPTGTAAGGGATNRLVRCPDVRHPPQDAGLGLVSVLTLDPTAPAGRSGTGEPASTAVTADGSMVYASPDRLYVATTTDGWDGAWGSDWDAGWKGSSKGGATAVHAFATDGDDTAYVASGEVAGLAPDRWAFSEHDARLRVATMLGTSWAPRESAVTVLEESGGDLVEVGRVGGLGRPQETIRAMRWFGPVAVIVTFKQTDPLYTLDLSDPTAPKVAGQLKIPGFSAYLHPIGGDLLLGVGQDAGARGRTRGSQLSTFDLSDLAHPRRVDTASLGFGRSPVEDDSRAFTYLPEKRLALVPTGADHYSIPKLSVLRITASGELQSTGSRWVPGPPDSIRALPLADGRVAVVSGVARAGGGAVVRLLAP